MIFRYIEIQKRTKIAQGVALFFNGLLLGLVFGECLQTEGFIIGLRFKIPWSHNLKRVSKLCRYPGQCNLSKEAKHNAIKSLYFKFCISDFEKRQHKIHRNLTHENSMQCSKTVGYILDLREISDSLGSFYNRLAFGQSNFEYLRAGEG